MTGHCARPQASEASAKAIRRVPGDYPLQQRRGHVQIALDRGQCDIHDAEVELEDELGSADENHALARTGWLGGRGRAVLNAHAWHLRRSYPSRIASASSRDGIAQTIGDRGSAPVDLGPAGCVRGWPSTWAAAEDGAAF